ncbi:MAG TPA: hypothetical protein VFJ82_24420 [Longimicrobium sp.]|nr:hypothetical protein [Longimicrobium sp.]
MMNRLNALALGVICGGTAILSHPAPASATYIDPWTGGGSGDYGVLYCCVTYNSAQCCHWNTGCATKPGTCIQITATQ